MPWPVTVRGNGWRLSGSNRQMFSILVSIIAFILAIGVLITVHEYGHFLVARKMGVKVLRFSVGFGRPLWSWRSPRSETEYVIAALPLGGYVKMVDEREGEVDPADLPYAFNRKSVGRRAAIVAAGPLFNLGFAVLAYWFIHLYGIQDVKPLLDAPPAQSAAAEAGFTAQERIVSIDDEPVSTWTEVNMALVDAALDESRVRIQVQRTGGALFERSLQMPDTRTALANNRLLENLGLRLWRPPIEPRLDRILPGGAAAEAGLQSGDLILTANGEAMGDWSDWVHLVRQSPDGRWIW